MNVARPEPVTVNWAGWSTSERYDVSARHPRLPPAWSRERGPAEPAEASTGGDASGDAATSKILVVDDDQETRSAVAEILRGDGFHVVAAGDAEGAVRNRRPPCCWIC